MCKSKSGQIRLNKEDTFEWIISSESLHQMGACRPGQMFYSSNFGIDDNWCLGIIPDPVHCTNPGQVKVQLYGMRIALK